MTTDKIKDQLIDFNRQFKKNSGHFKSFEVIFDYISFLKSEPYLKKLLDPLFAYVNKQLEIMKGSAKNPEKNNEFDNISMDILDPSTLSGMPIFSQEFATWQKALENKQDVSIMALLPVNLLCLLIVSIEMQEIKDSQKAGDIERTNELIKDVKDDSFSIMPAHNIKNFPEKAITSAQFLDSSMEIINKHIIDTIDSQAFLEGNKPISPISFDKENSILYIRGQEIKIALKSEKPIDHYILEAIFAKDLADQTDFVEISKDYLKEDYDGNRQRFRHACDKLNRKISKATSNKINDFISYTTEKNGWCQINHKYL
ncbi:TPA: hypothetical protein DCZ15_01470 [Candidatus Falkowbacteria bacterium]|nr:MAG: hypothetical protein UV95_C0003G0157 [Candidatus Falkowbacteria bacterium GW2011_GWF2_43_32]HBA36525.1 hypothetical protein [Candidatus Falkowbacteria bacterium]